MRDKLYSVFEQQYAPDELQSNPMIPRGFWAFCRYFVAQFSTALIVMLVSAFLAAGINVLKPVSLGWLVDAATALGRDAFLAQYWWHLVGLGVLFLVVGPLVIAVDLMVEMQTLRPVMYSRIRHQIHWYLLRHSWSYFQRDFAGRIASKSEQTTYALRDSTLNFVGPVWYVSIFLVITLVALAWADWRLAIPMLVWLVCVVGFLRVMMPILGKSAEDVADARSDLNGRMVDAYTNIQTIKLFASQAREDAYATNAIRETHEKNLQVARAITDIWLPLSFFNAAAIVGTIALGLYLWHQGAITIGALAMALPLTIQVTNMADWITQIISSIVEGMGTARDGMKMITQPHEIVDRADAKVLVAARGTIRFDHVTFAYQSTDDEKARGPGAVIRDFNLDIAGGEKVGIIGRSGAGKSTLVNLLLRFFDVSEGVISIDGQDISQVTQESLRANIAMVTQDTSLLHRSIRENILIGRPGASEADIIGATKQAAADTFIGDLQDWKGRQGFDAHAGERGVKLSGGQRQRIALARVILKDAPILILDEATSALDSEVEAAIQEQFAQIMHGKTAIVIAHRLSTIAALDRLVVLDAGRIIETGTHEELIKTEGLYAQLWQHQSGGFLRV